MAGLIGADMKPEIAADSRNHIDVLTGKDAKGREYVIEAAQTMAVTTSEWKYIAPCRYTPYYAITRTETGNSKEEQLYHLKNDLGERQNLAAEYPEK